MGKWVDGADILRPPQSYKKHTRALSVGTNLSRETDETVVMF